MTPDPSREIEQVIQEMREAAGMISVPPPAACVVLPRWQVLQWADRLALLTAASPVSPAMRADICGGCGGPYLFDTTVPSDVWNRVVRPLGISEFLCAACILRIFAERGESFTAELWATQIEAFGGLPIAVSIGATSIVNAPRDLRAWVQHKPKCRSRGGARCRCGHAACTHLHGNCRFCNCMELRPIAKVCRCGLDAALASSPVSEQKKSAEVVSPQSEKAQIALTPAECQIVASVMIDTADDDDDESGSDFKERCRHISRMAGLAANRNGLVSAEVVSQPPQEKPRQRVLCKSCFGEISESGFSVHGGDEIAERLRASAEGSIPSPTDRGK